MFSDVLDAQKEDIHHHREALLKIINNTDRDTIEVSNPTNPNDKRTFFVMHPRLDGRVHNLSEEHGHHD